MPVELIIGLVKAFHIIFMVTWFAGLFYLPRLFVYHRMADDAVSIDRFKTMESKLFFGIMTPSAILTLVFGIWLLSYLPGYMFTHWMLLKLALVLVLVMYHLWCGAIVKSFKYDKNKHSHIWYRWFNEAPVLILIAIVIAVVVKPFAN